MGETRFGEVASASRACVAATLHSSRLASGPLSRLMRAIDRPPNPRSRKSRAHDLGRSEFPLRLLGTVVAATETRRRAGLELDRLLHRSVVFNIDGKRYRMRSHRARSEAIRKGVGRTTEK